MAAGDEPWVDDDAAQIVRPYALTAGRTEPTHRLDLVSMVRATDDVSGERLEPELIEALELCRGTAVSVAELAAQLRQPVQVVKVLVSDLIDAGAVAARAPVTTSENFDTHLLEKLLDGLQQRL